MSAAVLNERDFLTLVTSCNVAELRRVTKKVEKKKLFLLANSRARKGRSPLHIACEKACFELLEFLLSIGANVNALDNSGWSPLAISAREKNIPMCLELVKNGADPSLHTFGSETTALHLLIRVKPFTPELQQLLDMMFSKGAQVNAKNVDGETPLDFAVVRGNAPAVTYLLKHGANPNSTNIAGNTALHQAVMIGESHKTIIETLLKHGADPSVKGSYGTVLEVLDLDRDPGLRECFYSREAKMEPLSPRVLKRLSEEVKSESIRRLTNGKVLFDMMAAAKAAKEAKEIEAKAEKAEPVPEAPKDGIDANTFASQPLVVPLPGYRIEEGTALKLRKDLKIDLSTFRLFYNSHFYKKKHINLVGYMWRSPTDPTIISIKETMEEDKRYMGLIRSKYTGQQQFFIPESEINSKKNLVKQFISYLCNIFFLGSILIHIKDPAIEESLKQLEAQDPEQRRAFSFGVVYGKDKQDKGLEFFENEHGSDGFETLLRVLGKKIDLNTWTGFRGGLGQERDRYSVFTVFNDFDIMFHVSTLLPYDALDPGKISRANKIGNDVCVIIYHEGDIPLQPDCITSNVCHVFCFVRPVMYKDKQCYRVAVASKKEVTHFEPEVPVLIESEQELREFILTKMFNAQVAAQRSALNKMFVTPRKVKIEEIVHKYFPPDKIKSTTKGRSLSDMIK